MLHCYIVTYTDATTASIALSTSANDVDECCRIFVDVCLTLSGATEIGNPFTAEVIVDEAASTATLGSDFQPGIVFPDGCPMVGSSEASDSLLIEFVPGTELTACGVVTILDDGIFEDEEIIAFTINQTFVSNHVLVDSSITIYRDSQGKLNRICTNVVYINLHDIIPS